MSDMLTEREEWLARAPARSPEMEQALFAGDVPEAADLAIEDINPLNPHLFLQVGDARLHLLCAAPEAVALAAQLGQTRLQRLHLLLRALQLVLVVRGHVTHPGGTRGAAAVRKERGGSRGDRLDWGRGDGGRRVGLRPNGNQAYAMQVKSPGNGQMVYNCCLKDDALKI